MGYGSVCWLEVFPVVLRSPGRILVPMLFRLPLLYTAVWSVSTGMFYCLLGRVGFASILQAVAGCTLLFAQHIFPRLSFAQGTWRHCLDSAAPGFSKTLESHPIRQSLAWIICTRLFHAAIAVALCLALAMAAPFMAVSVPFLVGAVVLVVLLVVCAGGGVYYLWSQYIAPLQQLLELNSMAVCLLCVAGSVLLRYLSSPGDVVFSSGLVLDCALQCGIAYQCSCAASSMLMAQVAIRMSGKAWKTFANHWRFAFFTFGLPVYYIFKNYPLLGIGGMELMEGAAAIVVGKIFSSKRRELNNLF